MKRESILQNSQTDGLSKNVNSSDGKVKKLGSGQQNDLQVVDNIEENERKVSSIGKKKKAREFKCLIMKKIINDSSPELKCSKIYKRDVREKDVQLNQEITVANKTYLTDINRVQRAHGRSGSFRLEKLKSVGSTFNRRKDEARFTEAINRKLYKYLQSIKPVISTKKLLDDYKEKRSKTFTKPISTKKGSRISDPVFNENVGQFTTDISMKYKDKRPRLQFEVSIDKVGVIGRFKVVIYSDYVPETCKNFYHFCQLTSEYNYIGCNLFQIFPGYFVQTGDVTDNVGFGGTSIYGRTFLDENFTLKHFAPGILSMCNIGPNTNNSQFYITFRKLKCMDGKNVVFGRVISGLDCIYGLGDLGNAGSGVPKSNVYISDIKEL